MRKKLSEEHKRKISEFLKNYYKNKKNHPMYGKTHLCKGKQIHTEESKRKISLANKGRLKSEEHKLKISLSKKGKVSGKNNPFYGRHHSEEIKKKISEIHKGKHYSLETEFKKGHLSNKGKKFPHISELMKGNKIGLGRKRSEESKKKLSETLKRSYKEGKIKPYFLNKKRPNFSGENHPFFGKHLSDEIKTKISEANKGRKRPDASVRMKIDNPIFKGFLKPTKPEKKIMELIKQHNLPYEYVGDGKINIGFKNPDFIHLKDKKLIEVFGNYFHNPRLNKKVKYFQTEDGRIKFFDKYGFKTLIIWEYELKDLDNVLKKIMEFDSK